MAFRLLRRWPSKTPIFSKVLVREIREDAQINCVVSKALRVLGQTELFEPISNPVHRQCRTDLFRSGELRA